MPTWRSLDAAAKQSGVSRRTLQRWVQQGRLTPYTIAGDPKMYLDLDQIKKLREPKPREPRSKQPQEGNHATT
jgi:predicted site-specific integrase-resolvase